MKQVPDVDNNLDYLSSEDGDQVDIPEDNADFMFGFMPSGSRSRVLQPPVDHVPELCRVFRENVNPLNKIVHEPTLDLWAAEVIRNPDNIPFKLEAVMFSIYTLAVLSLSEAACQENFNEQRKVLLTRYRFATKDALSRAKVLSTGDIVVLQAYVLHLLAMRNVYNAHTSWTLMGLAQRLAEGMGLHRDGTYLGLSPFETEMRRRLWWMMRMFDSHMAELAGHAKFKPICAFALFKASSGILQPPIPRACAVSKVLLLLCGTITPPQTKLLKRIGQLMSWNKSWKTNTFATVIQRSQFSS